MTEKRLVGRHAAAAMLIAVLLAGCAGAGPRPAGSVNLPTGVELAATPFFPDDGHFCGPAALATSLAAAGVAATPAELVGEVFLPGREGSLQVEMLAGARRHGAVATVIPGSLEALLRELGSGHPVVVLLNLGLSWAPSWHYAVAVGYDLGQGYVLLRSGTMKRQRMNFVALDNAWRNSERWAFVALPPGRLPATATEAEATRALVAFERSNPPSAAAKAYRGALERWPRNPTLAMGLGNALHAAGDLQAAERVFRATAAASGLASAYNNHARTLLELGRRAEARTAAESGLAGAGPIRPTLLETLRAIDASEPALPEVAPPIKAKSDAGAI